MSATDDELALLIEGLRLMFQEELDVNFEKHRFADEKIFTAYCQEYIRRGLSPPSEEMMDH